MPALESAIKIVVADNDIFFRQALIFDISIRKNIKIVACVSNGIDLMNQLKTGPADGLVVSAYLPYLSGIEAIRMIRKTNTSIKILAYTSMFQEDVLNILSSASSAYCEKNTEIISETLHNPETNHRQALDSNYYAAWKEKPIENILMPPSSVFQELRPVDIKIIALSCEGKTNKEIAGILNLSSRTIDAYSTAILEKLGFRNKVELVQFAFMNGVCAKNCVNAQSGTCIRRSSF